MIHFELQRQKTTHVNMYCNCQTGHFSKEAFLLPTNHNLTHKNKDFVRVATSSNIPQRSKVWNEQERLAMAYAARSGRLQQNKKEKREKHMQAFNRKLCTWNFLPSRILHSRKRLLSTKPTVKLTLSSFKNYTSHLTNMWMV